MLIDGTYAISDEQNGFPDRFRQVLESYGTGIALAQAIGRSEGAIRKWLRGASEPKVSDLRAICETTNTNVEWLVFGRGDPKRMEIREPCLYRYTPRRAAGSHNLGPCATLRETPAHGCLSPSDKRPHIRAQRTGSRAKASQRADSR